MKRIKFLCIVLLAVFFASLYQSVVLPFWEGVKTGYTAAKYQFEHKEQIDNYLLIDVTPKDYAYFDESEINLNTKEGVLIRPHNVTIMTKSLPDKTTTWLILKSFISVLTLIVLTLGIWVPFLLVKILRSLQKSEVFDRRNLKRINRIGLILLTIGLFDSLLKIVNILLAELMIDLSNYNFSYANVVEFYPIIMGVVILIMNEILRISIEIKEEQDMTI
ncbi:hypothetical protein Palpr_2851 [Paludibacter propionicigenes WB4]|uniref:Transmembrane protein n=1 Tax=Paludibacter propionicigenes (strain DSM 17365 / JCM 13257 / WB4) TaxID=694427 RepID=E4T8D6_PALPW|nr:DUF2975 domain-containing protein [Paludibacter propionicigenes]ADQ80980.1 hypothetical protein Palpr_2851 [Paludibacter propionicigenes WB4]